MDAMGNGGLEDDVSFANGWFLGSSPSRSFSEAYSHGHAIRQKGTNPIAVLNQSMDWLFW